LIANSILQDGRFSLGSSEIALRSWSPNFGCVGPFFNLVFSQLPFVVQAIQFETRKAGGNERITLFALIAVLAVLTSGSAALGQATASGTIQGTITDHTQAAVSGAQVELTSKETGAARAATSSDSGYFRFELLPVGTYIIKISKAGFATTPQTTQLLIGQTATVALN